MRQEIPEAEPGNRGLKTAVAVVSSLAVLALTAVSVLAVQRHGDQRDSAGGASATEGSMVSLTQSDLSKLVEDRTSALQDKEEGDFLAAFTGEAKSQQRRLFRNLLKVPMETATFRTVQSTGRLESSFRGGAKAQLDIVFVHQISGVDVTPVEEPYRWTVEKKSAKAKPVVTRVTGKPGMKDLGTDPDTTVAYPAPWDLYPDLAVHRTGHVVLMTDASHRDQARAGAAQLEAAASRVLGAWRKNGPGDKPVSPGFAITVEPDGRRYSTLYGRGGQAKKEDGVTASMMTGQLNGAPYGGARIVMKTPSGRVGEHEMAHALMMPVTGKADVSGLGGTQNWVVEGFAEYLASRGADDRGGQSALRRAGFSGRLPDQAGFYAEDPVRAAANYELARLALTYMADRYGKEKTFAFVAAQYTAPHALDQHLLDATGKDERAFEAEWADYVRSTVK
ncbi:hypothetical protein [Streptomyces syringium]|uniref:hypothetical protein n=1 Tax=Streptomyces syringium TaxID=76729 RepID=UPI0033CE999A